MGRPSSFTDEIAAAICADIAEGIPLREICRREGMPAWRTVYDWMEVNADFSAAIARARISGYHAIAEDCLDIADDKSHDVIETENGDRPNSEYIQRSKLRVETRLKLLAKWSPKLYGDKVQAEITGKDGGPMQSVLDVSALSTDVLAAIMKAKDESDKE